MIDTQTSNDRIGAFALLLLSFYWVWASAWPVASLTSFSSSTTLSTTEGIAGRAVVSAGVNSSLLGTDFQQGLVGSVVADTAAMGANAIGSTWGPSGTDPNAGLQTLSHATLGCAQGALTAGNCASGAAGAAAESVLGHVVSLPADASGAISRTDATLYATGAAALGAVAGQAAGGNAQSGANTAINAAVNNRLLHPDEQTTLSQLQQGQSPQEQYRLRAAACALTHCADGVSSNDPNKAALQKLQDDGQQYAAEQATLTAGGAFKYPLTDRLSDLSNGYQLPTRALGAAQGALGTVGAAGALVAGCDSVVACGLGISTAATSLDYAQAGYTQMLSGNPTPTYGEQVLQGLGMSPTGAALTYGGLSLAAGVGSALLPVGVGAATRPADSGIGAKGVLSAADLIGILSDASKGKGNFGLGRATASEAEALGQAWVGPNYRVASDGKTLVSWDNLRTYRPPSPKNSPYATIGVQANFERLEIVKGRPAVISNGHLDVTP